MQFPVTFGLDFHSKISDVFLRNLSSVFKIHLTGKLAVDVHVLWLYQVLVLLYAYWNIPDQ